MKKAIKKLTYQELSYRYQLLKELMGRIPDVIYFKDRQGRLVMVNQAHARGLGLKPDEVVGKTDFDFFPRERAALMAADDEAVMKSGKPIIDKVERATRPDGVDNYVSTTKIPRYDEDGKVVGLIGITRDITHRMQLERLTEEKELMQRKLDILEYTNKTKSEFVSVVSHELKTPLAIIKEATLLLLDNIAGALNQKQRGLLGKVSDRVGHLDSMINNLLDISRIERGKFRLHYSLANINGIIKDSADYFQRVAQGKGISLEYRLPKRQVHVFIDPEKINQVIINLINNAIKFTEQKGKITVEVEVVDEKVRVGVIDTGIGISEDDLKNIFQRFVQGNQLGALEKKGLGLGLSIAKEIVGRHNGEIWAESKLGAGSKFYFTLPKFHTAGILDKGFKNKVNEFLAEDISLFLVSLVITNCEVFPRRIGVSRNRLFRDIRGIINSVIAVFYKKKKEGHRPVISDSRHGEFLMLFPQIKEAQAQAICEALKKRVNVYFTAKKRRAVFINIKEHSSFDGLKSSHAKNAIPRLYIKKMVIGSEVRHSRRVIYKARINIILGKNKKESCQTVDLSTGGVCFLTKAQFKTDAVLDFGLELAGQKNLLCAQARVAWISDLGAPAAQMYKVGVKFVKLKKKDKHRLVRLIRLLLAKG